MELNEGNIGLNDTGAVKDTNMDKVSESDGEDEAHCEGEPVRDTLGLAETERLAVRVKIPVRDEEPEKKAEEVNTGVEDIEGDEERDSLDALNTAEIVIGGELEAEREFNTLVVEDVDEVPLKLHSDEIVGDTEEERVKARGLSVPCGETVNCGVAVEVPHIVDNIDVQDDTVKEVVDDELVDTVPDEHKDAKGERDDEEQEVEVTDTLGERDPLADLLGEVEDDGQLDVEAVWLGDRERDRVTVGDFDLLPEVE